MMGMSDNGGEPGVTIAAMAAADWPAVHAIYLEGIATGNATFETEAPDWATFDARHVAQPRLVARRDGQILGWATLSPTSVRAVYRGVAENSVYVAAAARGQGIGRLLLQALVAHSEQAGFWTLQTSIFPENTASLRLHAACGYRVIGYRERIAQLNGVWRDTVLLERRSAVVGR